ncbi:hypothetical protein B0H13DRAFT_1873997 [Mycena leptocephala]|nr:hypothetical protein B0H13DRAFT_1873997 [Mycena leptocephala]
MIQLVEDEEVIVNSISYAPNNAVGSLPALEPLERGTHLLTGNWVHQNRGVRSRTLQSSNAGDGDHWPAVAEKSSNKKDKGEGGKTDAKKEVRAEYRVRLPVTSASAYTKEIGGIMHPTPSRTQLPH